jgi:hypothetical protein
MEIDSPFLGKNGKNFPISLETASRIWEQLF